MAILDLAALLALSVVEMQYRAIIVFALLSLSDSLNSALHTMFIFLNFAMIK